MSPLRADLDRLFLASRQTSTPSQTPTDAPTTGVGAPPVGPGGGPSMGQTPFGGYEQVQSLSPREARALEALVDKGVGERLRDAKSIAPSARQQTQGELINLTLLYERLGNPFSVRRIPFSVLRDMQTDPMINFALFFTEVPLIRANWHLEGPDAQINAAVHEALSKVNPKLQTQICGKLAFGYQPMCKRFKLGELRSFYRDPNGNDPEKDLPVWDSDVEPIVWDKPYVLAPEHCMPRWNQRGEFIGFYYSIVPLPNPIQIGLANLYGYSVVPGFEITQEFAMWPINEQEKVNGSIYGQPRTNRAYRYWWSYWFRWALADRAFENSADPPRYVYYPTDVPYAIDPEDPALATGGTPNIKHLQSAALAMGDQMRSGQTLAIPGDFIVDESGRTTGHRKWEAGYYRPEVNWEALANSFQYLDAAKFRSMLVPEEAFIQGGQSSSGSKGGTSRLMGIQLGEVYQEAQQLLASENDAEINEYMIPQFIAANFPDRAGTPCVKVTEGFGAYDVELMKQIIQLVGQVRGEVLPVDIREVFRQLGLPLLSEKQQKQQMEQIAKEAEAMMPSPQPPQKVGMQGYNAGIERTQNGFVYVNGPERLDLDALAHGSNGSFLGSLPGDVPAYGDASVRASMMKLRKLMSDRYQDQIESFCKMLEEQTTLHLAQQSNPPQTTPVANVPPAAAAAAGPGLTATAAAGVAASVVGAWAGARGADVVGAAITGLLLAVAIRAARRELKQANLNTQVDESELEHYAQNRANFILQSIDSTVRGEMTTFLTDELQKHTDPAEVAEAARERFSETPQTHSDRVVLTETLPAYNYGMLLALRDSGVSEVQAHDASDGADQLTDPECKRTNGKVYSIEEALARAQDEHPNGTLYFTPMSTDHFVVERVESIPADLNGHGELAGYDAEREVLYISEEATQEQEEAFLLAIGEGLRLR